MTSTFGIELSTTDLRGRDLSLGVPILPRARMDVSRATSTVAPIIEEVRAGGETALLAIGERLDKVRPPSLRVPAEVLEKALETLDPLVLAGLEESIDRARAVHRTQQRREQVTTLADGATVTERWIPVDRVGLYVPGGRAIYVSSVVMNVVPAQEADVPSLAIASPPQLEHGGWPHPAVLAAARLLEVDEVYATGGAQAVAMFAYGARNDDGQTVCEPAAMVTGPGNVYVAAAKRLLRGTIGIDAEAGPTEVAILADGSADPVCVAADLISQAEHDPLAACILVTDSAALASAVGSELAQRVPRTRHGDRARESLTGPQSGVVLVDDIAAGLAVVNAYAAEHLEIHTRDAAQVARQVRNAGAVFVGRYSPVSLGDYVAGSNHVLPTGAAALHASGLSVQTFLKGVQVIDYDRRSLQDVAAHVVNLSLAEDLPAHGEAVMARFGPILTDEFR